MSKGLRPILVIGTHTKKPLKYKEEAIIKSIRGRLVYGSFVFIFFIEKH